MYRALMGRPELDQLNEVLGEAVDEVRSDGWAVSLSTRRGMISFIPEEIETPIPSFDSASVDRLRVAPQPLEIRPRERITNLGAVEEVHVLTTVVQFAVVDAPAPYLTQEYTLPGSRNHAVGQVELDLGVVLLCAGGGEIFISTHGFFAEFALGGLKDEGSRLAKCTRTPLSEVSAARGDTGARSI